MKPQQTTKKEAAPSTEMAAPKAAVSDETAVSELAAYEQFAGAGFENQTSDDMSIPFLTILQGLSPQLQDNVALRQGMIFNTVTGDFVEGKEGTSFVPVLTQHVYVEWKPRTAGGGFVGIREITDASVVKAKAESKEYGKYKTMDGNELIETFYVYGLDLGAKGEGCAQAVLAFTSSQIKKYKAWMTKARTIQIVLPDGRRIPAPLFAHKYRLLTVGEKNQKGSWFSWNVIFDAADAAAARILPSNPLFKSALALKKAIEDGKAKAQHESQAPAEGEGAASKEDAPF